MGTTACPGRRLMSIEEPLEPIGYPHPASSTCHSLMLKCLRISLFLVLFIACGSEGSPGAPLEPLDPTGSPRGLADIHRPDAEAAEAGRRAFVDHALVQGIIPAEAMRHLYIAWSRDLSTLAKYYADGEAYWTDFNLRYGTVPSPFEGARYPAGFGVGSDGQVGIDCLLCHAGRHRGRTFVGLSNNRLDLRAFVEDLQALPDAIDELKGMSLPSPYDQLVAAIPDVTISEPFAQLAVPTGAAGANDGFGLGLTTSAWYGDPPADLNTFAGYQDAPAWWTMRHKDRLYTDGSAPATGIYTMMSTLLAFGLTTAELARYVPTFDDIRSYLCTLQSPRWDDDPELTPVDPDLAAAGATIFATRCSSCHGDYRGGTFPNLIVPTTEIGTDGFRVDAFTPREAAWFNGFIPSRNATMMATDGYLAPDLSGIWASAPYLHNGSVPTLRALLVPTSRPTRWRRKDGYDETDVGLPFDAVASTPDHSTVEGRRVVDTTREAMGHAGHDIPLEADEVEPLLEFLKTL